MTVTTEQQAELHQDEIAVLGIIYGGKPKTAYRIAVALGQPVPYVKNLLEAMYKEGLVIEHFGPKPLFSATSQGKRAAI